MTSIIFEEDLELAEKQGTAWYRSKQVFPQEVTGSGYLANKKWPLIEGSIVTVLMLGHRIITYLSANQTCRS